MATIPSPGIFAQRLLQGLTTQQPPAPPADPAQPPPPPADPVLAAIQGVADGLTATKTNMDALAGGIGGQDKDFQTALDSLRKARLIAIPILNDDGGRSSKGSGKALGGKWGKAADSAKAGLAKDAANRAASDALLGQMRGLIGTLSKMSAEARGNGKGQLGQALECAANELKWGWQWQSQVNTRLDAVRTETVPTASNFENAGAYVGGIKADKAGRNVSKPAYFFIRELDKVEPRISAASYDSHVTAENQHLAANTLGTCGYWLQQAIIAHQAGK